jgi:hypothetical protein
MPRDLKIALGILTVAVLVGLLSLRGLHQRMQGLAESQSSEEKARREVLAPEIKTPTDAPQGARIYWAAGEDRVTSTTVELALSADPVERGKQTPSGIESEQLVVDSISRTLENNVATVRRLKILIHGQEVETLAGHVDLTGFFDLNPPNAAPLAPEQSNPTPATSPPNASAAPKPHRSGSIAKRQPK